MSDSRSGLRKREIVQRGLQGIQEKILIQTKLKLNNLPGQTQIQNLSIQDRDWRRFQVKGNFVLFRKPLLITFVLWCGNLFGDRVHTQPILIRGIFARFHGFLGVF